MWTNFFQTWMIFQNCFATIFQRQRSVFRKTDDHFTRNALWLCWRFAQHLCKLLLCSRHHWCFIVCFVAVTSL